jgi:flagellar biosynthetic protein FliP
MNSWVRLGRAIFCASSLLLLAGVLSPVHAAGPTPPTQGVSIQIPGLTMRGDSTSWTIVALMTLLTLLPALLLSATPFVRILVIFHFLRQALGTQSTPANQTLIGLSLFLTYFLMQPVAMAINQQALVPLESGAITT